MEPERSRLPSRKKERKKEKKKAGCSSFIHSRREGERNENTPESRALACKGKSAEGLSRRCKVCWGRGGKKKKTSPSCPGGRRNKGKKNRPLWHTAFFEQRGKRKKEARCPIVFYKGKEKRSRPPFPKKKKKKKKKGALEHIDDITLEKKKGGGEKRLPE